MERNKLRSFPGRHTAQARPGRPEHIPTAKSRHQVEILAALHCTHKDIAMVMQVSDTSLEKWYPQELRAGLINKNAAVATNLFRLATGSSKMAAAAAIFWLKTRAQMRETMGIAGEDGHGPILTADTAIYSTNEGRATRLAQLLNWISNSPGGPSPPGNGAGVAS